MRFAIRMCLFVTLLSGCAPAVHTRTDKESPSPEPDNANLSPEQQEFRRAFAKAIKDGHVNDVCQDMKGMWVAMPGGEEFKVCRPEKGYSEVSSGFVEVLHAWKGEDGGGLLMPMVFDCAGRRYHSNQTVQYDSMGTIIYHAPASLGGAWEPIKSGTLRDAVLEMVCKEPIKHREDR